MRPSVLAVLLLFVALLSGPAFARSPEVATVGAVSAGPSVLLTIAADGSIRVDSVLVRGDAAITGALKAAVAHGKTEVTIACDKSRPYGEVIHVMDLCKQAGLTKIAFAVAP